MSKFTYAPLEQEIFIIPNKLNPDLDPGSGYTCNNFLSANLKSKSLQIKTLLSEGQRPNKTKFITGPDEYYYKELKNLIYPADVGSKSIADRNDIAYQAFVLSFGDMYMFKAIKRALNDRSSEVTPKLMKTQSDDIHDIEEYQVFVKNIIYEAVIKKFHTVLPSQSFIPSLVKDSIMKFSQSTKSSSPKLSAEDIHFAAFKEGIEAAYRANGLDLSKLDINKMTNLEELQQRLNNISSQHPSGSSNDVSSWGEKINISQKARSANNLHSPD